MSSKWALAWKEDRRSPGWRKPRARLMIRGFQNPGLGVASTESLTALTLHPLEIKRSFLCGMSDERELATRPAAEFLKFWKEYVFLLKGNAYGRQRTHQMSITHVDDGRGGGSHTFEGALTNVQENLPLRKS